MSTMADINQTDAITGGTDGAVIGNTGDRLKVDANITGMSEIPAYSSKISYIDMNTTSGGVARQTSISNSTWTQVFSYTGSGLLSYMLMNFETGPDWLIRVVIDGNEIFGSAGILSNDITDDQIYDLDTSGKIETAIESLTLQWADHDRFIWATPQYPVKYNTSVVIFVRRKSAAASKKFRAGLIVLTKDT